MKTMHDYFHLLIHLRETWVCPGVCINYSRAKTLSAPSCKNTKHDYMTLLSLGLTYMYFHSR